MATRYPLRMAAGILSKSDDVERWLRANSQHLPHGEDEVEIILHQLRKGSPIVTTSCGRVLDAVAAVLEICMERTYEGEPAMKLEAAAINGKDVLELEPTIQHDVLLTSVLVHEVFNRRKTHSPRDLAFSAQRYLARGLAELAVSEATRLGVNSVGFSGGVAYNEHVTGTIREFVEQSGLKFVVHELAPAGDGGVSFGQTVAAVCQSER